MSDDALAACAAALAERLLDDVSRAQLDWPAIEQSARELAELAARAAGAIGEPPIDSRP